MRITATLFATVLFGSACGSGGGEGGGTGERRGVPHGREGTRDPSQPTPPSGAPARGALVVVAGAKEVRIGQNELVDCPQAGCLLADLVTLPTADRWCIDEPGMPTRELAADALKGARVLGRTKGGVKLVPADADTALAKSPARLFACRVR